MPAVYCCGGIYEGTPAPGYPLTTHTNGKLTKSLAPETDRLVGEVIAVTSGVVRFKLFV